MRCESAGDADNSSGRRLSSGAPKWSGASSDARLGSGRSRLRGSSTRASVAREQDEEEASKLVSIRQAFERPGVVVATEEAAAVGVEAEA